ncbi:WD40-repeat-containing domain protein [Polychytrium aggregatum]|uniref:WD40-repeat-containing domain protein n=1 Tax=Polychytrium aggregatum TaxID=110093 RepID=UPI0022FF2F48|nr:WD40-repeat-containing domain protein [Polychytrium aggregatum]KAI9205820.1 WD40-repeat-containing domain protein [Polychytrium aggregatum]
MASEAASDNAFLDQFVANYLRARGFKQAEVAFKQDAQIKPLGSLEQPPSKDGIASISIPDLVAFFNERESSDPAAFESSFGQLRRWVDESIDKYKTELRKILFPVYVNFYLDLISRGLGDKARHFLDAFRLDFIEEHGQDIQRLSSILEPHHIQENEFAQLFRKSKYTVILSRYSYELLIAFLQDNKLFLLLRIVNQHINIQATSDYPTLTTEEIPEIGILTESVGQWSQFNSQPVLLGELPSDAALFAEIEKACKDESTDAALKDALMKIKKEAASDSPARDAIPLPPQRYHELAKEAKELQLLRSAVRTAPASSISICSYTFHNTFNSLTSIGISQDSRMVAAGFTDSVIKLWDLENDSKNVQPVSTEDGAERSLSVKQYRRLVGHSGPVYACSFSPDTKYIVSASEDRTARLWSTEIGTNLVAYRGHNFPIWDVAFSPVGFYFATASHDKTARLWSCDHIYPLRVFVGHLSDVDVVRFHPNSNYVFTGSSDKTCRMWDIQTGSTVRLFLKHSGSVLSMAVSPDGRSLACAADDGTIALWDIASGRRIKTLIGHTQPVYSLCFSTDNHSLVSGGADRTVRLWDVQTSEADSAILKKEATNQRAKFGPIVSPTSTYVTKKTTLHALQFTRPNVLMTAGVFSQ